MSKVKHEVHSILAFNLTVTNIVAITKITRRNTMHKNTRSILGNPSGADPPPLQGLRDLPVLGSSQD
jgi:hypothetical protein